MAINAYISPLTVPADTEFPGTFAEHVAAIAPYLAVAGLSTILGVNFGPAEPAPGDRDKPWFKTTTAGIPVGWYGWTGSAWQKIPDVVASGNTAGRPIAPPSGQQYYDTTISALLIFDRGKWRTAGGSPGDIKYVKKATLAEALAANPGWIEDEEDKGRVLAGAGTGSGLTARTYGDVVGEETHVLLTEEIPSHTHSVGAPRGSSADNGDPGSLIVTSASEGNSINLIGDVTGSTGGGAAHSNMQPTRFRWVLVKE